MKKIILLMILLTLIGCQNTNVNGVENSMIDGNIAENNATESTETTVGSSSNKDVSQNTSEETNSEEVNEAEEVKETEEEKLRIQIAVDTLNVRSDAKVKSNKIGSVYHGSVYEVIDTKVNLEKETWYKIEFEDNTTGWIAGWFCQASGLESYTVGLGEIPIIEISSHYTLGSSLLKCDVLDGIDGYDLYINNQLVENSYLFEKTGTYDVYIAKDGLQSAKYTLTVIGNNFYGFIHKTQDEQSPIIGVVVNYKEVKHQVNQILMIYNNDFEFWYEINLGDQVGYLNYTSKKPIIYNIEKVTIQTDNDVFEFLGSDLIPSKSLFMDKYLEVKGSDYILVNPENGNMIHSSSKIITLDDDSILIYSINPDYDYGLYDLQIIDLSSGDFRIEYEHNQPFEYIKKSSYSNTNSYIDRPLKLGVRSIDGWHYADNITIDMICEIVKEDGDFQINILESPFINQSDKTLEVYSDFLNCETSIGTYKVSECENIKFMRIYDIIDDDYALWFEVALYDGKTGYAYRKRWEYESSGIEESTSFEIVMSDQSLQQFGGIIHWRDAIIYLESGMETLDNYILSSYFEGKGSKIINKDPDIEEFHDENSDYYRTQDKRWFIKHDYYNSGSYFGIKIFDTQNDTLEEVFDVSSHDYSIRDLNIIDSDTITFFLRVESNNLPVTLHLVENEWVMETKIDL